MGTADETPRRRLSVALLYTATLANFTVVAIYLLGVQLYLAGPVGGTPADIGITLLAFSVSAILLRPVVGQGIDRIGRRPFLIAAFVILVTSSLAFVLATSVVAVVALRMIQGVSSAMYYTVGVTIGIDLARPERRAAAISHFSIFLYGGLGLGPVIAEWVLPLGGFRAVWWTAAGLSAIGLACVLAIPETGRTESRNRTRPKLRLLHPAAIPTGLILTAPSLGLAGISGFGALYAAEVGLSGGTPVYVAFSGTMVLVRLLFAGVPDRLGLHRVALPGLAVCIVALLLLAMPRAPWFAIVGAGLFAIGYAFLFPSLLVLTLARVPDGERAEATGTYSSFLDVSLGGGGYLVGLLISTVGFGLGFGVPAGLTLVAMVALHLDRRRDEHIA
ncbi:MAG: MFS transporter [Nitriliruptoraceae bacterium]